MSMKEMYIFSGEKTMFLFNTNNHFSDLSVGMFTALSSYFIECKVTTTNKKENYKTKTKTEINMFMYKSNSAIATNTQSICFLFHKDT